MAMNPMSFVHQVVAEEDLVQLRQFRFELEGKADPHPGSRIWIPKHERYGD